MFVSIVKEGKTLSSEVNSAITWVNYTKQDYTSIRATTKNGPAMYKTDVNIESLERYAWEYGTTTTNGRTWKLVKFDDYIGATEGKDTVYMRIELTSNTNEIHGHPISESEYKSLLR